MSTEAIVGVALVAAIPMVLLVMFTWDTHKKLRETETYFGRSS